MVRLRLSTTGEDRSLLEKNVQRKITELKVWWANLFLGTRSDTLQEIVGKILKERKANNCDTAESCTGGYISHLITSIAGSSDYYVGSVITYSYEIKTLELNINADLLNTKGAVSQEVVEQMASEVIRN